MAPEGALPTVITSTVPVTECGRGVVSDKKIGEGSILCLYGYHLSLSNNFVYIKKSSAASKTKKTRNKPKNAQLTVD